MSAALTVAFVPGVSPAKWARIWNERLPDADLLLRPIGATEVGAALADGADMCFARMPVADDLSVIPLWTETPVVAVAKDAPLADLESLTAADLAGDGVTVLGDGPVPEDIDATLDLVETGAGVAVLPQSLFRAASRKDLVGRPLVDAPGTQIALVWLPASSDSALVQEFIGIVRGRSANSSRGRSAGDDSDARAEAAPTAESAKKKPAPKQKPIPGGPNSRGAQLANAKYKSGTRRTGGSGPKGGKRRSR